MKKLREIGALTLCVGVILSGNFINANDIEGVKEIQEAVSTDITEDWELPEVGTRIPGGIPMGEVQHVVYFKAVDADTGLPLQEIRSFEWYIPAFVAYTIEPSTKRVKISYRLAQWEGGVEGQWFNVTELKEMEVTLNRKDVNGSKDNWTNLKIERDNTTPFEIHILSNVSEDEKEGSDNNYLESLSVGCGTLEPSFTKENTEYSLQVDKDVDEMTIFAKAEDANAKVYETTVTPLSLGGNYITITVTAENNKKRYYHINIMRGTEEDKRLEEEKHNIEKNNGNASATGRYNTKRDLSRFSSVAHVATKISTNGVMIANSGMKVEEAVQLLNEEQKTQILDRLKQKIPYTSLGYTLKLEDMKAATQSMFTDEQINQLIASPELMAQMGINLNELVTTVSLQNSGGVAYNDIDENEDIRNAINEAISLGILEASKDGSFYPNSNIKFEEALKIMDNVLLLNQIETMKLGRSTIELYFKNLNITDYPYVGSIASKLQIKTLKNIANKQLGDTLTKAEVAQMIYEITEGKLITNPDDIQILDIEDASYEPALVYAVKTELMALNGQNISPNKTVTKGEMVQILMKLSKALKVQKEAEEKAKAEEAKAIASPEQDPLAVDKDSVNKDPLNRKDAE